MPVKNREVMVVPVREEAMAAARKLHVYAVPIKKSTSDVTYIGFYRGAPISAITHYATVERISKNVPFEEVFPTGSTVLPRQDVPLKVYYLGPLEELERRVKRGKSSPISGPRFTELRTLKSARFLDEVWKPEEKAKAPPAKKKKAEPPPKKVGREPAPAKETEPEPKRRRGRRGGKAKKKADKQKGAETAAKEVDKTPPAPEEERPKGRKRGRGKKKPKKEETKAKEASSPTVHYIVDGSNVALEASGPKEGGRLRQIELLMEKLRLEKGAAITVIVDANLRHHIDRKDDLERMIHDRSVLQAPAQTDADEFILLTAEYHRSQGERVVIISNDRYKDYIGRFKPRFDWVGKSQQQFMFVFSHDGEDVLDAVISFV